MEKCHSNCRITFKRVKIIFDCSLSCYWKMQFIATIGGHQNQRNYFSCMVSFSARNQKFQKIKMTWLLDFIDLFHSLISFRDSKFEKGWQWFFLLKISFTFSFSWGFSFRDDHEKLEPAKISRQCVFPVVWNRLITLGFINKLVNCILKNKKVFFRCCFLSVSTFE